MNDNKKDSYSVEANAEKKKRAHPALAIAGFFVLLFLFAFLAYLFQKMWITSIGAFISIAWAVFFSYGSEEDEET